MDKYKRKKDKLSLFLFYFSISNAPEQVAQEVLVFLNSIIPQLELASRLALFVDINTLAKACEGILAVTPEGVVVTVPVEMLAGRELLLLSFGESSHRAPAGQV